MKCLCLRCYARFYSTIANSHYDGVLRAVAGGFDHIWPEFQINRGRKFLTSSYWKLKRYKSIPQALFDSFMNFTNMVLNSLRP